MVFAMTPKFIQWLGGVLIFGILGVINVAAIMDIIKGEGNLRNEWIMVTVSGVIVALAIVLKFVTSRGRGQRKGKRRR